MCRLEYEVGQLISIAGLLHLSGLLLKEESMKQFNSVCFSERKQFPLGELLFFFSEGSKTLTGFC